MNHENRHQDDFGAVTGCIMLIVGVVLLMDKLDIHYFHDMLRYWPVILIAIGLAQVLDSQRV